MSRARSTPAGALLVIALLAASSPRPASAQSASDVQTARALFVEGAKMGSSGRWEEARQLYARSLQLKSSPITRYSLGVAQKETGHFAAALSSFRAFLAEPPTPASAPYAEPARAAVEALKRRVGQVAFAIEPRPLNGLMLAIDGVPVAMGQPRELDRGAHEVVARAPDHEETTARFSVIAGRSSVVTLTMTPKATADSTEPLGKPRTSGRTLPFVFMGAGGALAASGAVVGLLGVGQASDAPTRHGSDASAARTKGIVGDVLAGVGLATAGVGLVLLLTQGHSRPPGTAAVKPWMSGSVAGIEIRL